MNTRITMHKKWHSGDIIDVSTIKKRHMCKICVCNRFRTKCNSWFTSNFFLFLKIMLAINVFPVIVGLHVCVGLRKYEKVNCQSHNQYWWRLMKLLYQMFFWPSHYDEQFSLMSRMNVDYNTFKHSACWNFPFVPFSSIFFSLGKTVSWENGQFICWNLSQLRSNRRSSK